MKISKSQLRRLIEATIQFSDEEKEEIKKAKTTALRNVADGIGRESGISTDAVADAAEKVDDEEQQESLAEELKRIELYNKYDYGIDNIDPKRRKSFDKIIGHTWLTHVKRKGSALNEVGEVLWHSLKENGEINFYDVEWPDGTVETDIPAVLLEKVKDSDDLGEAHGPHEVAGHEEGSEISERKYKKKNKKRKKKKNKYMLYPYFFGYNYNTDSDKGTDTDSGGDFGGVGDFGGGE